MFSDNQTTAKLTSSRKTIPTNFWQINNGIVCECLESIPVNYYDICHLIFDNQFGFYDRI